MLRTVAGLAVTATLATAAPALATPYQDLRSADARDAARLAIAEQRRPPAHPTQDLRSPDTRDAARGVIVGAGVSAPARVVAPATAGFDWGDAALGADGELRRDAPDGGRRRAGRADAAAAPLGRDGPRCATGMPVSHGSTCRTARARRRRRGRRLARGRARPARPRPRAGVWASLMSSNHGREASVSIRPGHSAMISLLVGEVGRRGARGRRRGRRRPGRPSTGCSATCRSPRPRRGRRGPPRASRRRARRRRRGSSAARGEAAGDPLVELVERAERAGDDDQPAARAQARGERAQHRVVARLLVSATASTSSAGSAVRAHARGGVGEDDVDLAELRGQRGDGVARRGRRGRGPRRGRRGRGDRGRGGLTRSGSRPVSRTRSWGAMRAASPSTSARPSPWLAPVTRAMREAVMHLNARRPIGHARSDISAQLPCVYAWLRLLADRPAGPARGRAGRLVLGRGARARLHAVGRLAPGRGAGGRRRAAGCSTARRDGVVLTPAGARLLPRAVRILDELDAALREARRRGGRGGPVRLGAFATAAAGLVPEALATLPPRARSSRCARGPRPR